MNRKSLIYDFFAETRVSCVEVQLLGDGKMMFHYLLLQRKGTRILIEKAVQGLNSIEDVVVNLNRSIPAVIVVTGKGVVIKELTEARGEIETTLLRRIFPDATLKDFFLQTFSVNDDDVIAGVIRKNQLTSILSLFSKEKIPVAEIFIGPFVLGDIVSLFVNETSQIATSYYEVLFNQGKIKKITGCKEIHDDHVSVADMDIRACFLLCFAAGFRFLVVNKGRSNAKLEEVLVPWMNYRTGSIVKKGGIVFLASLFVLLLINFLVFDYYNRKTGELAIQSQAFSGVIQQIDSLQTVIKRREAFFSSSGLSSSPKTSFYIDQLAASIPKEVRLSELNAFPIIVKRESINPEPVYFPRAIKLQAIIKETRYLNQWIKQIEGLSWVESVVFADYQDNGIRGATVNMEIKIR